MTAHRTRDSDFTRVSGKTFETIEEILGTDRQG